MCHIIKHRRPQRRKNCASRYQRRRLRGKRNKQKEAKICPAQFVRVSWWNSISGILICIADDYPTMPHKKLWMTARAGGPWRSGKKNWVTIFHLWRAASINSGRDVPKISNLWLGDEVVLRDRTAPAQRERVGNRAENRRRPSLDAP